MEEEVKQEQIKGRKLRLVSQTLEELIVAKHKNEEHDEAAMVADLKVKNTSIKGLLVSTNTYT